MSVITTSILLAAADVKVAELSQQLAVEQQRLAKLVAEKQVSPNHWQRHHRLRSELQAAEAFRNAVSEALQ